MRSCFSSPVCTSWDTRGVSGHVALAHTAAFAISRGAFDLQDLASELSVSKDDAEKILQTAVQEGHLRGRFDDRGRFIAEARVAAEPDGARP